MDIFLTKDGKSLGPYSAKELREKLAKGEVELDESAWSAESGDWIRLEAVLELAEKAPKSPAPGSGITLKPGKSMLGKLPASVSEVAAKPSGEEDGADQAEAPEATSDSNDKESDGSKNASQRMTSSKLRSPTTPAAEKEGASGRKKKSKPKKDVEPVRAVPTTAQRDQRAKKSKVRNGSNPLSFLRWLGLLAFAAFAFTLFMPWVTSKVGDTRSHLTAVDVVKAKPHEVAIPGSNKLPKFFRPAKIALLVSAVGVLLGLLLTLVGAVNPESDSSGMGILLLAGAILGLITFGVLQGHFLEGELNTKLQDAALNGGFTIEGGGDISLDIKGGFYLAIAAIGLMVAFLAIPGDLNGSLSQAMVPWLLVTVVALCIGGYGVTQLGEGAGGAVEGALTEMKNLSGQLTGAEAEPDEDTSPTVEVSIPPAANDAVAEPEDQAASPFD